MAGVQAERGGGTVKRRLIRQVCGLAVVAAVGLGLTPALASASPEGAGAPDQFGTAPALPRSGGGFDSSNVGASKQVGEPNHANNVGGRSVWFRFRPNQSGTVRVSTAGSNFDTLLAVYTGTQVNNLTRIRQDDDSGPGSTSRLQFQAQSGVVYRIAIDGYRAMSGPAASGYISFSVRYL